ncbi:MAG: tRNA (adenosine(37)-N6)-threonylcarbamoyltransferase complex dimerization subunit type 1 TsaB [Candidatus Cryosericum sp.]
MSGTTVLLISTATISGVIGVARDGQVMTEVPLRLAVTSNRVVAAVDQALAEAGCQREEISGIVLVKGPGTFTGSRVGASIAKALSYALPCPLTSVTTLEALAWTGLQATVPVEVDGPLWAILDARRHQFYAQEFLYREGAMQAQGQGVCLGPEVFDAVRRSGGTAVCAFAVAAIPEDQRPDQCESVVWEFNVYPTCRGVLAGSANASIESPFTLEPVYLRTTEELFDGPKVTS